MSFVFYPKHQYGCPHVMHCPHLGGAALGNVVFEANENEEQRSWLFRQLDGFREENAAQARRIAELVERVEQLEAELKAERPKLFQAARPEEEETPAGVGEENQPKKRGAPVGHPGWFRPTPTHIDRTLEVAAPACCPHCGAAVLARPDLAPYEHIQEDPLDGRRTATCYRHEEGRCTNPNCRLWVRQAGDGEILRAKIGPQMRARGLFLRFGIGLPFRKVVGAIEGLDSLGFTPAAWLGFEKQAALAARPLAHDVAKKLRACEVNHADEQPGGAGDSLPGGVAEGDLWQSHPRRSAPPGRHADGDSNGQAAGAKRHPILGGLVYAHSQRGRAGDVRPLLSRAGALASVGKRPRGERAGAGHSLPAARPRWSCGGLGSSRHVASDCRASRSALPLRPEVARRKANVCADRLASGDASRFDVPLPLSASPRLPIAGLSSRVASATRGAQWPARLAVDRCGN